MKPQIKPTAMPCETPERAKEMTELCEKHGIKVISNYMPNHTFHIVNDYCGKLLEVGFIVEDSLCRRDNIIPYHPELFMYNSGIFPEKWCVRGSKEFKEFAIKQGFNMSSVNGTFNDRFYHLDYKNEILTTPIPKDDPPTDYVEVTLEELMFHYEAKATITEQPKWEDRTRGGYEYKIYEEFEGKIFGRVFHNDMWGCCCWIKNGIAIGSINILDLIPYNPLKAQLLAEKEELKKRIEEIERELKK